MLGSSPWLLWNAGHGWRSFVARPNFGSNWSERFWDWTHRLSTVTGTTTPFDEARRLLPSSVAVTIVVLVVAVASWSSRTRAPGLVAFSSNGRIAASSYGVPRFPELEAEAAARGRCTYVLRLGAAGGADSVRLVEYLQGQAIDYERRDQGAFAIFWLTRPVAPRPSRLAVFGARSFGAAPRAEECSTESVRQAQGR